MLGFYLLLFFFFSLILLFFSWFQLDATFTRHFFNPRLAGFFLQLYNFYNSINFFYSNAAGEQIKKIEKKERRNDQKFKQ